MEHASSNTHVETLNKWRERGIEAEFICHLTQCDGEKKPSTAFELLSFLCDGSPATRLVLQRALAIHLIEKVNKVLYKSHQKMIVAVTVPANAVATVKRTAVRKGDDENTEQW